MQRAGWPGYLLRVCLRALGCLVSSLVLLVALVLGLERRDRLYPGNGIEMPSSLVGKVALVTGSSSGIGYEAASLLLSLGAHVVVHSPSQERAASSAAALLRNASGGAGGQATPLAGDLANFTSVRVLVAELRRRLPKIDFLFLNAGLTYGPPPSMGAKTAGIVLRRKPEEFVAPSGHDRCMATNHLGHFLLTELLLPHLTPEAVIVITGSQGAWRGGPGRLTPPWGAFGSHVFAERGTSDARRIHWHLPGLKPNAFYAYWDSKFANVCFARWLRRRFKDRDVVLYDPGLVVAGAISSRDSDIYRRRLYRRTGWAESKRAPVWDGGLHLVQSAFVTQRPLPDAVVAFFFPKEILGWFAPQQRAPWRARYVDPFMRHQRLTWGLHAGVAPGCDEALQDRLMMWSARETGLFA